MSVFGPEYHKIQTAFLRDERGIIIPDRFTLPEFEYLLDTPWCWTEKVDGTNIRVHFDGESITVGGRTDAAQIPGGLMFALGPLNHPPAWREAFADCDDVTLYGEGYGRGIQSGGQYRKDQEFILFDVRVGRWWLQREDVADVARKLGLDVVPCYGHFTLRRAIEVMQDNLLASHWPGAQVEGLVGTPAVPLFNRKGDRIITKLKVKDFEAYRKSLFRQATAA